MNQYLTTLLNTIGIDLKHLKNEYLSSEELEYIDSVLASESDFAQSFYTNEHGDRLESLLCFLIAHKQEIIDLMHGEGEVEAMIKLYTSCLISGDYDCFRFDLTKFQQSYTPISQILTLYRIGRDGECAGNLGCSWAINIDGLRAFCHSSGISKSILKSKPVFVMEIDDSQVLFEGNSGEHELVLKPDFTYNRLEMLDDKRRNQICS